MRRPLATFICFLPLLGSVGHDAYIAFAYHQDFQLSETGWWVEHYTPYHDRIGKLFDSSGWKTAVSTIFHAKTVVTTGVAGALVALLVNRRRRGDVMTFSRRGRR